MSANDRLNRLLDSFDGTLNEHYRQLRQLWREDFIEELRGLGILPGATGIGTGSLPPGTMVNRGTYSPTALYRPGDLVIGAGGVAYVAIRASTGVAVSDTTYWQPLGGTAVPPPPDTYAYVVDSDGAYVIDADGAYVITYGV